jgi:hypothetical protein
MIRSSNTFFGAVLAVAFSQIAFAADLPTKAPLAPVVTPPNWTGLYIGGSVEDVGPIQPGRQRRLAIRRELPIPPQLRSPSIARQSG